jgi:IclR family transcriptional regulator, pca regulon regulatory protein
MSKGKFYFSKSLEKGLKILSLFNRERPSLTQSEIARILELNMTSTYRYINTLVELGYLEKDPKTKAIRPSVHCLLFCSNLMRATDHLRLIREVVDRIHAEHNISIEVAFAVEDTIVRIYHKEAAETLTYSLPDFSKNCLHNTSLGKAYLSSLSDAELKDKVRGMDLAAKTENTICERKGLIAEIKKARKQGFAMAIEEFLPGLIAIGAPLVDLNSGRGVGAVSFDFSVIQNTPEDVREKYSKMVMETADALSRLIPPDRRSE